MKRPSQHIEWLSLIEVSGPFLAVGLLEKAFPQGLEKVETPRRQKLRAAYDEWCEAVDEDDAQLLALHREWVLLVLADILEYSREVLFENSASEEPLEYRDPEHGVAFAPSLVVRSDGDTKPRLLISVYPPGTDLEKVKTNDGWPISLMERMVLLCRSTGVRLGLLTNGDRWMLVNAPVGATSSHASWYARLWFQEPLTLKAFQSLLGIRRFFGPADETLDALLEKSLEYQEEVTDTLGAQVRRAVEVLVQCLDKADQDRNRELLRDVSPSELYEAGLTVMMRLVFVLCAEERGLLLLGDPVYDQCYAVSTLRGHLGEAADRHGPEVLERRHDAWTRLLSVFRAVYGGIEHESLRLPAMGGSLFDPDRFPFLEGRLKGTCWRETPAVPLPIDNRTVLLLLEALQVLEQPGGALLLSYRALDVEQIGHVYEGLLEHTVARVPHITVGLAGSKKAKNPNLPLADLESARMDGEAALLTILLEATQRSEPALRRELQRELDAEDFGRLLLVCGGDVDLAGRIRPFANLLRTDAWGEPIVYRANSFMVTLGADRRETGTHYTPKSLTETIVSTTLEPLAYVGPAEGLPRTKWQLKPPSELLNLKICDPAMGSGAFLVQVCRWLGERVVEAWAYEEAAGKAITIDGEVLGVLGEADPMPKSMDERLVTARRLVAERCLYGVDINPMAVELAKMSIWLVTLAKGRPFGFLDHNLRSGDSLIGIHQMDQIIKFKMNPTDGPHQQRIFGQSIEREVAKAIAIRQRLRAITIRDIRDVESMTLLDKEARRILHSIEIVANAIIAEVLLSSDNPRQIDSALDRLAIWAGEFLNGSEKMGVTLARRSQTAFSSNLPDTGRLMEPFHWPLEFPEVFQQGGFDAFVDNPPFGSASGGIVTDDEKTRGFWKMTSAEIAIGAYDRANVFIFQSTRKLKDGGVYGFLMPQSNLSPGGATPLQQFLNLNAPPSHFFVMENPRLFGGANVFVSGIVGIKGIPSSKTILHAMPRDADEFQIISGESTFIENTQESWWEWISRMRSSGSCSSAAYTPRLESLTERFEVFAGCATGAAYELKPLVLDNENGHELRLVTTGALDRFVCTWGLDEQKYLKRSYLYPRWPSLSSAPNSIANAGHRQEQPKILLGGLTKVLEGYYDSKGLYGGVVATWVIVAKNRVREHEQHLLILETLINSQVLSWQYSVSYGAQKSPWGGMTIKKKGLETLLLPSECFEKLPDADQSTKKWELSSNPWQCDASDPRHRQAAILAIHENALRLEQYRMKNDMHSLYALDEALQPTICWLYGKSLEEHQEIRKWFLERDRLNRPYRMYDGPSS